MSHKASNWVFEQRFEPTDLAIMIALADWADGDGYCYPGQQAILSRIDISQRTLIRRLASLEERGFIRRERRTRSNGARTSDGYWLAIDGLGANLSPDTGDVSKVTPMAPTREPSVEPSVPPTVPQGNDDAQFDRVWNLWPRKDAKKDALRSWRRLTAAKRDEVLPKLAAHAAAHRQHTETRYIPYLSTWLNAERWDDTLPEPRPQQRGGKPVRTLPAGVRQNDEWMYG